MKRKEKLVYQKSIKYIWWIMFHIFFFSFSPSLLSIQSHVCHVCRRYTYALCGHICSEKGQIEVKMKRVSKKNVVESNENVSVLFCYVTHAFNSNKMLDFLTDFKYECELKIIVVDGIRRAPAVPSPPPQAPSIRPPPHPLQTSPPHPPVEPPSGVAVSTLSQINA